MTLSKVSSLYKSMLLIIGLTVVALPNSGWSYNKSWDQGHKKCVSEDGSTNWGQFDESGTFHGGYTSKECCELLCKVCPIYANTGRYQKTFTDLTVPGNGPNLSITRTYNSQEWSSSLLGYSWTFNFGRKLIITKNNDDEKIIGILLPKGEKNYYREDPDGTLTRLTDYGADYDLLKNEDNTYTIHNIDGSWHELREDGKIAKIIDKNQNELVFTYNEVGCLSRITNASGNYVDFLLGANGKIASVTDNLGRTVAYGFDGNGNLTAVTDPLGNTTQYVYDSNNFLTQIIDARGNTIETAVYDTHEPPRVSSFIEKGETYTIEYFDERTEKTDSHGNKWTYYFNNVGVIQSVVDPLGNVKTQQLNKVTSTSVDWEEDLNGNRTTYTYDSDGNITSKTDPLGNTWTYTYVSGTDLLETETNPPGVVTRYLYDANGNQTAIIRDAGGSLENTTTYTYNSQGNQTSVIDPLGNTTTYEYDANGNVIRANDPLGNATTYTYDNRGNRLTETNALGNTTSHTYNLMNQQTSMTDALGNTTTYTYDANGNPLTENDSEGNTRSYVYDAYNRRIQDIDALGNDTLFSYDYRDNLISKTDPNGNTTTYTFDILDRLTQKTDALGRQTTFTHDAAGNLLTITDANGNTTTFGYDANNQKISETNAIGEVINYAYDANGNLTTQALPNGNTISSTYDSLDRIVNKSDTIGVIENYVYDLAGRLINKDDAQGNMIAYAYDANGRILQQTDPMGNATYYSYDTVGNLINITDRETHALVFSYDALNRKISETDQLGNISTFTHDNIGNLETITDAHGNTTRFAYDNVKRLIQETYADGTTIHFTYDPAGNMITKTDQDGNLTTYVYNALNKRTNIDYPGDNDNAYTYDDVGNLLTANNQNAAISLEYDSLYRLIQSDQNGQTTSYSYDTPNRSKLITYPSGQVIKEVRNFREMLAQVENALAQRIVQYSYDHANRLVDKIYLNGITANFTHDANQRITNLNYDIGASQIISFQYGFDKEGNRLYAHKSHDPSNSEQYIYDNRYRLTQFKRGTLDNNGVIATPTTQTAYDLDALSNWTSRTTDGLNEIRTHNVMNEINDINGVPRVYDDRGNLIDDGVHTYEYDFNNHLLKAIAKSDGSVVGEYKYDALGRRIEKQASGTTTAYYYDGDRVIEEHTGGATAAVFVYGIGIDDVVSMERDGTTIYYLANSLGSIVALTDPTGSIIEEYSYDAYGTPNVIASGQGNPYRYAGRRLDEETALYHYRYRNYDSATGRFLQHDLLGYEDSLNLYEFVQSNPINRIDPYGLASNPNPDKKCLLDGNIKLTNSGWDESGDPIRKNVKFTFKAKCGTEKNCCFVNFRKGYVKRISDGAYGKVKHLGNVVDANFPNWTIDSVDADPVYWSDAASRWNFVKVSDGEYYTTDAPSLSKGYKRDYSFKMCIYNCKDVSSTATTLSFASALKCKSWDAKATFKMDGTITHP